MCFTLQRCLNWLHIAMRTSATNNCSLLNDKAMPRLEVLVSVASGKCHSQGGTQLFSASVPLCLHMLHEHQPPRITSNINIAMTIIIISAINKIGYNYDVKTSTVVRIEILIFSLGNTVLKN